MSTSAKEYFVLRPHQQDAVDETVGELAFGSNSVVIEAPTAFGKSAVIAGLCRELDSSDIVILVNITELIDQIAEHLDHLGLTYSILKAGRESEFNHEERIHIAMAQTLLSRIDKVDITCDLVIQDEIHKEFDTKRTRTILDRLSPDARVGLSATPFDAKNFKLRDTTIIRTLSVMDLQNQGYLTPVRYFIPKWSESIDYSAVKSTGADYTVSKLDEVIATHKHIEQSIQSMNEMNAKDKKTIVFCSSIEQCDAVTNAMISDGYAAVSFHSKSSKDINRLALDWYKNNQIDISFEDYASIVDEVENQRLTLFEV